MQTVPLPPSQQDAGFAPVKASRSFVNFAGAEFAGLGDPLAETLGGVVLGATQIVVVGATALLSLVLYLMFR